MRSIWGFCVVLAAAWTVETEITAFAFAQPAPASPAATVGVPGARTTALTNALQTPATPAPTMPSPPAYAQPGMSTAPAGTMAPAGSYIVGAQPAATYAAPMTGMTYPTVYPSYRPGLLRRIFGMGTPISSYSSMYVSPGYTSPGPITYMPAARAATTPAPAGTMTYPGTTMVETQPGVTYATPIAGTTYPTVYPPYRPGLLGRIFRMGTPISSYSSMYVSPGYTTPVQTYVMPAPTTPAPPATTTSTGTTPARMQPGRTSTTPMATTTAPAGTPGTVYQTTPVYTYSSMYVTPGATYGQTGFVPTQPRVGPLRRIVQFLGLGGGPFAPANTVSGVTPFYTVPAGY